jgi:serine/threonine-protein kinase
MASVHFGRLSSDAGFSRTVAIKYLHPHHARDAGFIAMFLDEARLVSRIRHPNVATPLDVVVVSDSQEVFLVMEYIHGETLSRLIKGARTQRIPMSQNICASIMSGALNGLHAAHEAVDELGDPLNIVHRDISPQNIMVGEDGVARVLDFGIAKAVSRSQSTQEGHLKGKVAYMSPEQLTERAVDRRADIFAAGIVLWEALTMRRLFETDDVAGAIAKVLHGTIPRPSSVNGYISPSLDAVVLKALSRNPASRFQTAREFAVAIEEAAAVASTRKVSEWVSKAAAMSLAHRAEIVARIESEPIEVDLVEEPSAKSMLTVSQTVALLDDNTGTSGRSAERAEREPHTPPPTPIEAQRPRTEAPTQVLAARTSQVAPSLPDAMPAAPPLPTHEMGTLSVLIGGMKTRRRIVVGGASVALALILTLVGLSARSTPQSSAGQQPVPAAKPAPVAPQVTELMAEASEGKNSHPGLAAKAPEPAVRARPARIAKAKKPAKDCDPPFFIDANGIRRIKARCL